MVKLAEAQSFIVRITHVALKGVPLHKETLSQGIALLIAFY